MSIDDAGPVATPGPRGPGKRTWLIIALVASVAAGVLLASTIWTNRWNEPEIPANAVVAQKVEDLQAWCAAQSAYDAMRRELFRRAAEVRGSDEQAYARMADFALLRVTGPVAEGIDDRLKSVSCSANAVLDLPPGVATSGKQRSLSGGLDYTIQPAADGSGKVVRLGDAVAIVVPLATLSGLASPPPQQIETTDRNVAVDQLVPGGEPGQLPQSANPPGPEPARASPSFACSGASSDDENAVCGDPGLAALDRQMAAQFHSAMMNADREQRRLLQRTRGRFLSYRRRCATNQCIAETYRSRMSEISDIMNDRWRG